MRLDWSRPYAEVIGRPGVAYEQDGHCFRFDGSLSRCELPPEVVAPAPPPPPAPIAKAPESPPRAPRKQALRSDTILRRQFGEDFDSPVEIAIKTMQRDVLASYRDPQASDGSMVVPAKSWVDGV